jgi:hypothetical protein
VKRPRAACARATALAWCAVATLAGGCGARFVDERPQTLRGAPEDLGAGQGAPLDLFGLDLPRGVLGRGQFVGRAGHFATGGVQLVRQDDGHLLVELDDGFAVTDVPGAEVYLTGRDAMGATIAADDLDLGLLRSSLGAQSYLVTPGDAGDRRNVFIYCRPFGLEVAKAGLASP